jgi:peptidoglycan-N-acetylglucosamine deacetylase
MKTTKHKIVRIIFISSLVVFLLWSATTQEFSFYILLYIVIIYATILFLASLNPCWSFYGEVICKNNKNNLLLTFDDGPHPRYTPIILKILKKYKIKAIFFCIGNKASKYPDIIKKIKKQGHTIANHSYSHSVFFAFFNKTKITEELVKTNHLLEKITKTKTRYFRPPVGITNPQICKIAKGQKMIILGWSLRSFDTFLSKRKTLKRLLKTKHNEIILLHDNRKNTPIILELFLKQRVCFTSV